MLAPFRDVYCRFGLAPSLCQCSCALRFAAQTRGANILTLQNDLLYFTVSFSGQATLDYYNSFTTSWHVSKYSSVTRLFLLFLVPEHGSLCWLPCCVLACHLQYLLETLWQGEILHSFDSHTDLFACSVVRWLAEPVCGYRSNRNQVWT